MRALLFLFRCGGAGRRKSLFYVCSLLYRQIEKEKENRAQRKTLGWTLTTSEEWK
jgi:hypothetical protein